MAEHTPVEIVRHASVWSIVWGVWLIVFGMLAIGSPFLAAVAVNVVIAWLIVLAGIVHVVLAFHAHGAGSVIWKLLVGLAYLLFGAYLIMHPLLGVVTLTLVLATLFLIEGILDIVLFFKMRHLRGSSWVLVDGISARKYARVVLQEPDAQVNIAAGDAIGEAINHKILERGRNGTVGLREHGLRTTNQVREIVAKLGSRLRSGACKEQGSHALLTVEKSGNTRLSLLDRFSP